MSEEHPGDAEIVVIHHPLGITHGCKKCRQIHLHGEFAVGLLIHEDGREYRYAIGYDPGIWCCGEEKPFFQVFSDEIEAELVCEDVRKHLNTLGTTKGLKLIGFRPAETGEPEATDPVSKRN